MLTIVVAAEITGEEGRMAAEPIATITDSPVVETNPPTTASTAPIVSEEELEIGTSFPSLPPPEWGLNEKENK